MKHKIQGFVIWQKSHSTGKPEFRFSQFDPTSYAKKHPDQPIWSREVTVGPCEIEVDVPDDFDPRGPMIETLRAQKQHIIATMTAKATAIDHEIGKLLALDHKVAA